MSIKENISDLLWSVQLAVRYHSHRVRFFDRIHQIGTFISIALGSGAAVTIASSQSNQFTTGIMAATVALISTIELAFSITKKRGHTTT